MSAAANLTTAFAALAFSLALCQTASATPPAHSTAASGAQSANDFDKSAQSLRQDRLRKCKVMTGDEKAACERDAREVSAEKARSDAHATGTGKAQSSQ